VVCSTAGEGFAEHAPILLPPVGGAVAVGQVAGGAGSAVEWALVRAGGGPVCLIGTVGVTYGLFPPGGGIV
jgi:hypothetical protein